MPDLRRQIRILGLMHKDSDFPVFSDSSGEAEIDVRALSVRLSDRHFGPGPDGMIKISPASRAGARNLQTLF